MKLENGLRPFQDNKLSPNIKKEDGLNLFLDKYLELIIMPLNILESMFQKSLQLAAQLSFQLKDLFKELNISQLKDKSTTEFKD